MRLKIGTDLLEEAKNLSNIVSEKQIVEEALKNYIANLKRQKMVNLFDKVVYFR